MVSVVKPNEKAIFIMQVEQATYLPEKCRNQRILDYIISQIKEGNENCSVICWPSWWNYNEQAKENSEKFPKMYGSKSK